MPGQPRGGLAVVVGAHERMHVTIVTIQQAGKQLLSNEAGRPGKQYIPHP